MADNNPSSPDSDGNGGNEPAAGHHDGALAIQSFDGSYKDPQSDRAQHDHKIVFWSRLTGSFVVGYTLLTTVIAGAAIWSAYEARKAVKITGDNFRMDQRPYVLAEDIKDHPVILKNGSPVY